MVGCRGVNDTCSADPPGGTTVAGHSHIYPAIPTGVDSTTRTYKNPVVRYLEGGDEKFGHYVEQRWQPNNNALLSNIAADYVRDQP